MSDFDGVICGDMDEWVDKLIDAGIKYDLILTDPPYNINKDFGNDSDKLSVQDFVAVSSNRIKKLKQLLTTTGSILWFGSHD